MRPPSPSLSVVVVTHDNAGVIERTLSGLAAELQADDQLIVVDNASSDGTADVVSRAAPHVRTIRNRENVGFPAACNQGAAEASRELLLLLNPDAVVQPGFGEAIRLPLVEGRWAAWMGLVTMGGGDLVNTSGGVLHFTGVAWAGEAGCPATEVADAQREVAFVSGACLAIPLARWRALGGLAADYFLYHEDVDLSLRLRLGGGTLGLEPAARADHDYEFAKGQSKWRLLERNRLATVIRTYPAALLVLVAPAMAATEIAVLISALGGGWAGQKLLAASDLIRALPRLRRERRAVQAQRVIGAAEFARGLTADLDSPYIGSAARIPPIRWALRIYWRAVLVLLGLRRPKLLSWRHR